LTIEDCAYKEPEELTEEETQLWLKERALCARSFMHFMKWVRIVSPPKPGEPSESIVPIEMWEHTKETMATFLREKLITILKARQIGLSTIVAVYVTWYALNHVAANILLFSQGQDEAKALLKKCRNVFDQLPNFYKWKLDPDSTESIGWPMTKSVIKAFPSTPSAGIGETASILVWDEHAKHDYADQNYTHAKPTIDGGGQVISIFTADPFGNDNLATALFQDALEDKNGFYPLFFSWDVVPNRTQEWYERTKRSIPDRELAKLSPELYMAKNYPHSIKEALSMSQSVAVFDHGVLKLMLEDVKGHINEGWELKPPVKIYKDFHLGGKYVAASDVGWGLGGDYSVTVVMDDHGDVVADVMTNTHNPDDFAEMSINLLKHFRNPWWWIENNTAGGGRSVIHKAVELGYRKLGHRGEVSFSRLDDTNEIRKVGFTTNESSRADLFGNLISAINDTTIRIYNKKGLDHFFNLIRNYDKDKLGGRIEAQSGTHDDYVIAVGIANLKRRDAVEMNMNPVKTLDFSKGDVPEVLRHWSERNYAEAQR